MENDAGTLKEEELVLKLKLNPATKLLSFYERVLEEVKGDVKGVELHVQESSKLSEGLKSLLDLKGEWF
jgi:hypothetical protein